MTADARSVRRAIARRARKAALKSRHAAGCTCQVEARVTGWLEGAVPFVELFHDSWCPALRHGEGPTAAADHGPELLSAHDPELAALQLRLLGGDAA
jgi:hypothetical protein